jgi:hypothetical protein
MVMAESDVELYPGHDVIAIDPGVNFGMTIIDAKGIRAYNGVLLKQDTSMEYGWYSMNFIKDILSRHEESSTFVLEGAAYHKTYGQVGLADVRTGFYLGARMYLGPGSIRIVAPASARKGVFDDGKYQAGDAWPQLNHNAADALALALFEVGAHLRTKS